MKKILAVTLVLILALAISVPALAANETSGNTTLTYNVGSNYTISISPSVTLDGDGYGTGAAAVNKDSLIPANKKLTFTITGATNYGGDPAGFRLKNDTDVTVFLGYTINNGETPVVKDSAFLQASSSECYAGKSVTLTYQADTVEAAGGYSDMITFAVATVSAA